LRTKPKIPTVVRQDRRAKKSPHFVGYEGMSMIAVAGLDMAAWDALAGEASVPLCALAGGSIGLVPAYNSNGVWLRSQTELASEAVELREEGEFNGQPAMGEFRRPPHSGNPSCTARRNVAACQ
jgi:L-alanine-DL-glutamate epimerase-like enolase superfamily enzyme